MGSSVEKRAPYLVMGMERRSWQERPARMASSALILIFLPVQELE